MRKLLFVVSFLIVLPFAYSQTYLNATGSPTFNTPEPVELGYANLANGNLHLQLPFGSWPQRGAIGLSEGMVYDSRIWQVVSNKWQPTNVANSMSGWRFATSVDAGNVTETVTNSSCNGGTLTTYQAFIWTDPNGTQRPFPITTTQNTCTGVNVTSGNAFASDSSGYHMYITNYTSAVVFAKNGNKVSPSLEDTNGNYFTLDANGNVIDTLGRTPATKTTNSNLIFYDVLNSQGTTSRYTVTTETITVSTSFAQGTVTEFSGPLTAVESIGLPDGSSYSFGYDGYGEVNSVTLRTGGLITYGYLNFSDSYGNINRWVNTRLSAGGTWTYAPSVVTSCSPGTVGCQQTVKVSKPAMSGTDDTLYSFTLNNGAWNSQVQAYTGSSGSGTLLRTVATDFDFTNACPFTGCFGNAYIRPTRLTTTDPVPGSSILKKIELAYDSIYYGNVSAQKEWLYTTGSFNASPDRETDYTYLTISGYITKDIVNRPIDIVTKNGASAQVAETKYSYDTTTLVVLNGFSHHDDTNFGGSDTTRGNVTQVLQWVKDSGCTANTVTCLTTSRTYSTDGQMLTSTNPKGNQTSYSYSDAFSNDDGSFNPPTVTPNPPTHAYLTAITYPNSQTFKPHYYFGSGKSSFEDDENAERAFHHYIDSLDRPTTDYDRELTDLSRPWKLYNYTSTTQTDVYTGITDTIAATTCTGCRHDLITYDTYGRTSRSTLASDPDGQTFVDTAYDSTSRTSSVSNPYRTISDPTYGLESFQYDGLDRQTLNTHQDTNKVQAVYGAAVSGSGGAASQLCASGTYGFGYPTLTIDEANNKSQTWIDAFGRNIESDEPDPNSGTLIVGTCYQYDALNNLTKVVQASENSRLYEYDGLSRQKSATEAESGATTTQYTTSGGALCSGVEGNACRISDARSITTTYTYDTRDRLTGKSYTGTTHAVTYTYDGTSCNGLTITEGKNRRTCMTDAAGTTAWSYDATGHIVTEKRTVGTITKTISNTYNVDGSIAAKTYPSTNVITYTYSHAQRVTAVQNTAVNVNYATSITYAPQGGIASMTENNGGSFAGITYTRSYNNRLQLTATQATSSNGTAFDLGYGYDLGGGVNNGNLASLTNNKTGASGRSVAYTYDTLNRISTAKTTATSGTLCWGQQFGYDRYANLLTVSKTSDRTGCAPPTFTLTVDTGNHIAGDSYDSAGNLTFDAKSSYHYAYDAENHMTTGNSVTYTHDGDDWRVKKSNGDLEWHDTSCGGDLVDVFDLSGNLSAEYYYVGHMLFASRSLYYFGDNVGSVRVITDTMGSLPVQRESDYYAFGGELPVVQTLADVRKFNSKKRDTETLLDYAHLRMYSSELGRWHSVDPVGPSLDMPQSLNRYAYVRNNPAVRIDPAGGEDFNTGSDDTPSGGNGDGSGGGYTPVLLPWGPTFYTTAWGSGPPSDPTYGGATVVTGVGSNPPPSGKGGGGGSGGGRGHSHPTPQPKPKPKGTFDSCCAAARATRSAALTSALFRHVIPSSFVTAAAFVGPLKLARLVFAEGGLMGLYHGGEVFTHTAGPGLLLGTMWWLHSVEMVDNIEGHYKDQELACQDKFNVNKSCNAN